MSGRCLDGVWRVWGRFLEYVWKVSGRCQDGVWSTKKYFVSKILWAKDFQTKDFSNQRFFGPKVLWTKKLFGPKIVLRPNSLELIISLDQNFFGIFFIGQIYVTDLFYASVGLDECRKFLHFKHEISIDKNPFFSVKLHHLPSVL